LIRYFYLAKKYHKKPTLKNYAGYLAWFYIHRPIGKIKHFIRMLNKEYAKDYREYLAWHEKEKAEVQGFLDE